MNMKKLPKNILIYQYDEVDGEPVYSVACGIEDIPEDMDGKKIGIYNLLEVNTFRVHRELK